MWDHNLTHHIIKTIMEGGGSANEDFKSELRSLKKNLNKKLLEIRHRSYADQNQDMIDAKLDLQSVLVEAKRVYREVKAEFIDKK